MKITILPPTERLVEQVARRLVRTGSDFSRNLVVFAGKRPAFFLRRDLGRTVGGPFVPPTVLSVDQLVERLADLRRNEPARPIDPIEGVALLFRLHREQRERLGGDHFLSAETFFPLGEKMFAELEEMKLAMLSAADATAALGAVESGNRYLLADMYDRFYALLASQGLTTRAADYVAAADTTEEADLATFDTIIVAGLYAMTRAEQVLFSTIGRWEKTEFLFVQGPGLRTHVERLGAEYPDDLPPMPVPRVSYITAPDTHGQLAAVAARIKQQKHVGDESSVLVVPDPGSLFPVVDHLLPMFPDDGYNISMGYPLQRTPLAGLFRSIADAVEGRHDGRYFLPRYLSVLLHPYIKNARFDKDPEVTRILIHTLEERLLASSGIVARSLEEIESDDELFTRAALRLHHENITADGLRSYLVRLHDHLFRPWQDGATLGAFADGWRTLVVFLHDHTSAPRHPYFRSFAEVMNEGIRTVRNSPFADEQAASAAGAFRFFGHLLAAQTVPFPGSPLHGYQVLGLLETRGLSFPSVTIIDANDDVLPGSGDLAPLIPQQARSKMRMETRADRDRIAEYYFTVLISGAKEVLLAWNDSDGQEKSRFVERMLWREQQRNGGSATTPERVRYASRLEPVLPAPLAKSEDDVAAIRRGTLSATALDAYLHCPLRFYYGTVLRLSEREDLSGEIEALDIGSLVHDVLRRSFDGLDGRVLTIADLEAIDVEPLVDEAIVQRFGPVNAAAIVLMRERLVRRVRAFLREHQMPLAGRTTVELVERETAIEGTIGSLRFRTKPDRVERRTDEETRNYILDFKTGGNADRQKIRFDTLDPDEPSTWHESIGSLQLYVYTVLYAQHHGIDPKTIRAAYVYLGMGDVDEKIERKLFDDGEEADGLKALETVVARLLAEMVDVNQPFRPTAFPEDECPHCPFTTICGTEWTKRKGRRV